MKKLLKQDEDTGNEFYYNLRSLLWLLSYKSNVQLVAVKIGILNVIEFITGIFILFK